MLSNTDELDAMLAHIYDSIAEPHALEDLLGALARHLDAHSAILFTPAIAPECGGLFVLHQHEMATIRQYCEYYYSLDLWHEAGRALAEKGRLGIVTGGEMIPRDVFERSEFYNDFLKPIGTEDVIATDIPIHVPGRNFDISLAFHAGRDHRGFDGRDKELLATLVPHLRRAVELSMRLGDALDGMRIVVDALDKLADGVLLLTADGSVLHATPAALALLNGEHGLQVHNARLRAWLPRDNAELAAVLARASPTTGPASGGAVAICSPRGEQPLVISVFPLPSRTGVFAEFAGAQVLAILRDPVRQTPMRWDLFARHFAISPAELRLCQSLFDDVALPDYCAQHALSENTARSQLKSVFSKTGVRRQSELLKLIRAFA